MMRQTRRFVFLTRRWQIDMEIDAVRGRGECRKRQEAGGIKRGTRYREKTKARVEELHI